ncbi:hypothetical protein GJY91_22945, partial [Salmonella enterica]|nr:hypothetical protein [Salmonella enterica]
YSCYLYINELCTYKRIITVTKITLSPQNFRIQKQETTLLKEKSTEKNSLAKSILAVKNHFIELRSKLSERFISHKNTESSATHFTEEAHLRAGQC